MTYNNFSATENASADDINNRMQEIIAQNIPFSQKREEARDYLCQVSKRQKADASYQGSSHNGFDIRNALTFLLSSKKADDPELSPEIVKMEDLAAQEICLKWQKTFGIHDGAVGEQRQDHLNSLLIDGVLRFDQVGQDRSDARKSLDRMDKAQLSNLSERLAAFQLRSKEFSMTEEGGQSTRALKELVDQTQSDKKMLMDAGYEPVGSKQSTNQPDAALEVILMAAATPGRGFNFQRDWNAPLRKFHQQLTHRPGR
jgi:hypothetical protein